MRWSVRDETTAARRTTTSIQASAACGARSATEFVGTIHRATGPFVCQWS